MEYLVLPGMVGADGGTGLRPATLICEAQSEPRYRVEFFYSADSSLKEHHKLFRREGNKLIDIWTGLDSLPLETKISYGSSGMPMPPIVTYHYETPPPLSHGYLRFKSLKLILAISIRPASMRHRLPPAMQLTPN